MTPSSAALRGPGGRRCLRVALGLSLVFLAGPGSAQEPVEADLTGEVRLDGEPLAGAQVVLHRVSPNESGELDSIPSRSDGTFLLSLPHVPDSEDRSEVFFASVRHQGILYFGPPVTDPVQLDSAYVIEAYDTVSAPVEGAELTVLVRNVFIERDEEGLRATDLFQIGNDGNRTFVPRPDGVTWAYPLPSGSSGFLQGQGDLPPEQITFENGQVLVTAPLPPGERLLVLRYRLDELTTTIPMPGVTQRAELLIREPAELEPGSSYRRFLGEDLNSVTAAVMLVEPPGGLPVEWMAVLMAFVLAGVAVWSLKRSPAVPAAEGAAPNQATEFAGAADAAEEKRRLLLEIARLDEEQAGNAGEGDEGYLQERASLLARLSGLDGS